MRIPCLKEHVYLKKNGGKSTSKFRLEQVLLVMGEKCVHLSAFACPSILLSQWVYFRTAQIIVNEEPFHVTSTASAIKDCWEVMGLGKPYLEPHPSYNYLL